MEKFYNKWPFHVAVIVFSIVSDQLTKLWAVARFTDEAGNFTYEKIPVIGELVRFQLVYNKGAAFSSRPQDLMPFLPPWLFFLLISSSFLDPPNVISNTLSGIDITIVFCEELYIEE